MPENTAALPVEPPPLRWWTVIGYWVEDETYPVAVIPGLVDTDTSMATGDHYPDGLWETQVEATTSAVAAELAAELVESDFAEAMASAVQSTATKPTTVQAKLGDSHTWWEDEADWAMYSGYNGISEKWSRWGKAPETVELTIIDFDLAPA